jgi:hypothetical protein
MAEEQASPKQIAFVVIPASHFWISSARSRSFAKLSA